LELQSIINKQKIDVNKIDKYYYYRNKRWDLQNENGLILMLSSKDIKASLEIYKKLIDSESLNLIKIVDLRIPNQIILTHE